MKYRYFTPGTVVHIGDESCPITATITQVNLQYDHVSYCVTWWNDKERKAAWFEAFEVREVEVVRDEKEKGQKDD